MSLKTWLMIVPRWRGFCIRYDLFNHRVRVGMDSRKNKGEIKSRVGNSYNLRGIGWITLEIGDKIKKLN